MGNTEFIQTRLAHNVSLAKCCRGRGRDLVNRHHRVGTGAAGKPISINARALLAYLQFNIALLSVPSFVALLFALQGLAITKPAAAGAAAGLLAGAIGLFLYSWYCTEMAVQFWGAWCLLGMLVPCGVGALVGRAILKW